MKPGFTHWELENPIMELMYTPQWEINTHNGNIHFSQNGNCSINPLMGRVNGNCSIPITFSSNGFQTFFPVYLGYDFTIPQPRND